jgi:TolB protein
MADPRPALRIAVLATLLALAASLAPTLAVAQAAPLPWQASDELRLSADLSFVAADGGLAWSPAGAPDPRSIGAPGASYAFPTFAPDGGRIAAIERRDGRARAVVVSLPGAPEGTVDRQVWFDDPAAPVIYLDWRDDGRALLLLVGDAGGFTLRVATPDGEAPVLARGAPLFWDQGPDGLVVHLGGPGPARLVRLGADGAVETTYEAPGAFRSPAVSPSGGWLAYGERATGDVRRAVIVRDGPGAPGPDPAPAAPPDPPTGGATGDEAARRALDVRGLTAFAWHPRRDLLALTRPLANVPHSFGPLGGLDADSGLFEPWTDASVLSFAWAPDGRRIGLLATPAPGGERIAGDPFAATLASLRSGDVGAVGGPAGEPPRPAQRLQGGPLQLPLGLLDPDRGEVLWLGTVVPQASYLNEQVPFFDQYARSHRTWSPDGRYWGLSLVGPDGRDVVAVLDGRSGALHEVAPGTAPVFAPR